MQDKGPGAIVGHTMKDKSSPAIFTDIDQRKRLILQQVPQPASTNNISVKVLNLKARLFALKYIGLFVCIKLNRI